MQDLFVLPSIKITNQKHDRFHVPERSKNKKITLNLQRKLIYSFPDFKGFLLKQNAEHKTTAHEKK